MPVLKIDASAGSPRIDRRSAVAHHAAECTRALRALAGLYLVAPITALLLVGLVAALLRSGGPVLIYAGLLAVYAGYQSRALHVCLLNAGTVLDEVLQLPADDGYPASTGATAGGQGAAGRSDGVARSAAIHLATDRSSEAARAFSTAVFRDAYDALARLRFARSALVLAGLFGTVMFFALELPKLTAGQFDLTGIRGAMLCTLTGISFSVGLGAIAAYAANLVDRAAVIASEAVVLPVTSDRAAVEPKPVVRDAELWTAVIEEVRALRSDTQQRVIQMADDANSYALSLQRVEDRLANAPAITLREEIERLSENVNHLARTANEFSTASAYVADAARTIGALVPVALVEKLSEVADGQTRIELGIQSTRSAVLGVAKGVNEVSAILGPLVDLPGRVEKSSEQAATLFTKQASKIDELHRDVRAIPAVLAEEQDSLNQVIGHAGETSITLESSARAVAQVVEHLGDTTERNALTLDETGRRLAAAAAPISQLAATMGELRYANAAMSNTLTDLREQQRFSLSALIYRVVRGIKARIA